MILVRIDEGVHRRYRRRNDGDEMIKFINQLSSSGAKQSLSGNYGVGAKIAAATKKSRWCHLSVVEE